jgi:hypothetical protein
MKRASTNFLRLAIILVGLGVLALCIFALPAMWHGGSEEFPAATNALLLIVIGMYVTAAPFFFGLWQTFKLLKYIDQGTAFSQASVQALRKIKYCAGIIAIMYVGGTPLLIPIAHADDAPGVVLICAVIAGAPVVIAVFAAVLQRLVENAVGVTNNK